MWSYTFTDYANFATASNAVTPRPSWSAESGVNVLMSTDTPLDETDYNAMEFSQWKQFGEEFLIKSNINNWVVCSPRTGNLVEWQSGDLVCKIAKRVTDRCSDGPPPSAFRRATGCGPTFEGGVGGRHYYYFDGCTGRSKPVHESCGDSQGIVPENVENPHGNIFVR